MGMAYTAPTADQIASGLNRSQRRAIATYARTRKISGPIRGQLIALGILKVYWDKKVDWTALGAKVWYALHTAETRKQIAELERRVAG